jgi:hypothetical protein
MLFRMRRDDKEIHFASQGKNLSKSDIALSGTSDIKPQAQASFPARAGGIRAAYIARDEGTSLRKMPDR